jgi:DNA-binding NarL/FixJ family response regulator
MSRIPIRVLLVDHHPIFSAGLRLLLERTGDFIVIGEARTRKEAFEAANQPTDIILIDLDLGIESSLDFLPELMKATRPARVLVLTGVLNTDLHLRAICMGAMGIALKADCPEVLLKAIRKVHAGEVWMNRSMMAAAVSQLHTPQAEANADETKIASLTPRELDVIAALAEGRRNKEIAERLFISEKTVRHYLTSIFDKLEVADRLELIIYVYQHGLAKVPSRQTVSHPV